MPEIEPGKGKSSPIMTWGVLEDTPLRLSNETTYRIPAFSEREYSWLKIFFLNNFNRNLL